MNHIRRYVAYGPDYVSYVLPDSFLPTPLISLDQREQRRDSYKCSFLHVDGLYAPTELGMSKMIVCGYP
jgi:hypothetical protein